MTNPTPWTDKETRTLHQNMHLAVTSLKLVLPNRSYNSIKNKKDRSLKNRNTFHSKNTSHIVQSLKRRNWNAEEITLYIRTIKGDISSQMSLENFGLWNIKASGVMS